MTYTEAFKDAVDEALLMERSLFVVEAFKCRVEYWTQMIEAYQHAEKHDYRDITKIYHATSSRYVYSYTSNEEKHIVYIVM